MEYKVASNIKKFSLVGFIILCILCGCSTDVSRFEKLLALNGYEGSRVVVYPSGWYAEPPAQYLVDERGRYIDANGNYTDHPVENPYYKDYIKRFKK